MECGDLEAVVELSFHRLLYGVRVTCHRFSLRGLVTAQT